MLLVCFDAEFIVKIAVITNNMDLMLIVVDLDFFCIAYFEDRWANS